MMYTTAGILIKLAEAFVGLWFAFHSSLHLLRGECCIFVSDLLCYWTGVLWLTPTELKSKTSDLTAAKTAKMFFVFVPENNDYLSLILCRASVINIFYHNMKSSGYSGL